ncbi:MAG: PhzF family phenazine biosynthesis protein [Pseudomonadota bacterium]
MRHIDFQTWDVFTSIPFEGNPLAVVFGAEQLREDEFQAVAREFNLSETVFVLPPSNAHTRARLRIFTPVEELPFAGHPTIGAAQALAALDRARDPFVLELNAGEFALSFDGDTASFVNPNPPTTEPAPDQAADIAQALRISPDDVVAAPLIAGAPTPFMMIETSFDAIQSATPDMGAIARLNAGEVYPIARVPGEPDTFRARLFAPSLGVPEDPATGSAACAAPAYFAASQTLGDGEYRWTVEQGIEMGRPSAINVEFSVRGGVVGKVTISGAAVQLQKGTMSLPDLS